MTVYRFRATPLTPIHVGNGNTLAPEDYQIEGDYLLRFNRAAVLSDMTPERRRQLESALDKNDFPSAQKLIQTATQPQHVLNRIRIGAESRETLQTVVKRPDTPVRSREVHPFVFNPLNGRAYFPGSSLKGAMRTAVVNALSRRSGHPGEVDDALKQRVEAEGNIKRRWGLLESEALDLENRPVDRDPFRLLKVADAELDEGTTRVDQVWLYRLGKEQETTGIQMHYERLLSRADSTGVATFTVTLEVDERAAAHPRVRDKLGTPLNFRQLQEACNAFYWRRLNAELNRFFPKDPVWKSTHDKVKIGLAKRNAEGQLILAPPPWPDRLLLRVGRFCQFESLSVDNLRQGWNIQKRKSITEGSSRTLCRARADSDGASVPVPFGWLLLERE